jgi:hypothetical protein
MTNDGLKTKLEPLCFSLSADVRKGPHFERALWLQIDLEQSLIVEIRSLREPPRSYGAQNAGRNSTYAALREPSSQCALRGCCRRCPQSELSNCPHPIIDDGVKSEVQMSGGARLSLSFASRIIHSIVERAIEHPQAIPAILSRTQGAGIR